MTLEPYRWGFIGAGKMARNMANDLLLTEGSEIYAVNAATRRSTKKFAKEFNVQKTYLSTEDLINDPAVDVVYISTPNNLHFPNAKASLKARKAVLLEKPFTLNSGEARELISLARKNKTFLMEAMWIRFLPAIVHLKKLLSENILGKIQFFKSAFHLNMPAPARHRLYNPDLGGGSLLDLGIYPISFASMIFNSQPDQIASLSEIGPTGVDHHFGAVFDYHGGEMALVSAAMDGEHLQDTEIYGEKGRILVHGTRGWKLNGLTLDLHNQPAKRLDLPYKGAGYPYLVEEVISRLNNNEFESKLMPLNESLSIMETLDQLREQWGMKYPNEEILTEAK